jgi:hypothetical protein
MKGMLGRTLVLAAWAARGLSMRRVCGAATFAACASMFVGQDACVLAASSGDLQRLPESRPTIVHAQLVPTTSAVLTQFPRTFIVPVELADPTVPIVYAAFVDYNPFTGEGLVLQPRRSVFEAGNTKGRTRILEVAIPDPDIELDRCHVIEIIVALRLKAETDPKNAHTPEEPGGDVATWFYNPNGDLGGCPSLDGGIDAPVDADAAEGGPQ